MAHPKEWPCMGQGPIQGLSGMGPSPPQKGTLAGARGPSKDPLWGWARGPSDGIGHVQTVGPSDGMPMYGPGVHPRIHLGRGLRAIQGNGHAWARRPSKD